MDHPPSSEEHISNAALGQGVGYGIVLGLGGAFALGELTIPILEPVDDFLRLTARQA
jgi:hypothetical protein